MSTEDPITAKEAVGWVGAFIAVIVGLLVLILVIVMSLSAMGRYNARQTAKNNVKVSATEIKNQEQRIQVEKNKAEIRRQEAIGIREAQEEIAKTLTPLYVQFEMTQVLMEIAHSGNNNSVVYLPVGPGGIPIVDDVSVSQVGEDQDD